MTEKELFEKNLELSTEFSKYLLSHPELEAEIPEGAQLFFLVEDAPELSRRNRELAEKQKNLQQPVVFVHVKGLRREISRLIDPTIQKAAGF